MSKNASQPFLSVNLPRVLQDNEVKNFKVAHEVFLEVEKKYKNQDYMRKM